MNRHEADAVLTGALDEIRDLRADHKPGHAPLEAIYRTSTPALRRWVYAECLEGRSLQGREELQRRDTAATLMVAKLSLAVSLVALTVSVVAVLT